MLCQQQEELKQWLFYFTLFINKTEVTPEVKEDSKIDDEEEKWNNKKINKINDTVINI